MNKGNSREEKLHKMNDKIVNTPTQAGSRFRSRDVDGWLVYHMGCQIYHHQFLNTHSSSYTLAIG